MSAPAPQRDVLRGGRDDRSAPSPLLRVLAAVVAAAALLAWHPPSAGDAPAPLAGAGGRLDVAVRSGVFAVPRGLDLPSGRVEAALLVEVVNTGPRAVSLTSATLTPGPWQVGVVDASPLPPGWSRSLSLHRRLDCRSRVQRDRLPEELALVGTVDGEQVVRDVSLRDVRALNDGPVSEALHLAHLACGLRPGYDTG